MAAIRVEADLTCVARSGHPDDPAESLTPGHMESGDEAGQGQASGQEGTSFLPAGYESQNMTVIETIVGGERVLTPVPRAPDTEADDR